MELETGRLPLTLTDSTPEYGTTCCVVTLEGSLEEYLDIKALPSCIEVQTEVIARSRVTDDASVTWLISCILASINITIAIEVFIHDVTSSPATSECALVNLCEVLVHLILALCDTDCGITPDVSELSTSIV